MLYPNLQHQQLDHKSVTLTHARGETKMPRTKTSSRH